MKKQDESDFLDNELAELYQKDVNKFIDESNFEVESLSGFSQFSGSSLKSIQGDEIDASKQKDNDYLRKLYK